jgi:hypothetical protein
MGRNGRESDTRAELRREAANRLAAVKQTAAALEDRLREKTEQIHEAVDRTVTGLHQADKVVHRYRYALIGGAAALGFVVARRRANRVPAAPAGGTRYVLVAPQRQPGVVRSLMGGLAALALRQGLTWLLHRLEGSHESHEQRLLPPGPR